jgi:lysophospholipase L1-like esterase
MVIYDGNSLSDSGYQAAATALLSGSWTSMIAAVGAQSTVQMLTRAAQFVDAYYNPLRVKNVVVAWEVTNDLYGGASADDAYNRIVQYCQERRAAGPQVVVVPALPRSNPGTPIDFETKRQDVNTRLRNNWPSFADAFADVAADPRIGDAGDETDTEYYVDRVHLTTTGKTAVAEIVAAAINGLP